MGDVVAASWFEPHINFLLHRCIHLDERRPRAFETFAGNFLRRVKAALAAAGNCARRMPMMNDSRVEGALRN
jgi:hypothetical protein